MNMNPQSSKHVLVCACGLLAAFFMPWFQLLGLGVSGYNLDELLPEHGFNLAKALFNKGYRLRVLDRPVEALSAYKEILVRGVEDDDLKAKTERAVETLRAHDDGSN